MESTTKHSIHSIKVSFELNIRFLSNLPICDIQSRNWNVLLLLTEHTTANRAVVTSSKCLRGVLQLIHIEGAYELNVDSKHITLFF